MLLKNFIMNIYNIPDQTKIFLEITNVLMILNNFTSFLSPEILDPVHYGRLFDLPHYLIRMTTYGLVPLRQFCNHLILVVST